VGEGVACVAPIYEGYCLPHAIARSDFAGAELTEYLRKLLVEANLIDGSDREIVRDIKEKVAYVSLDFDEELKLTNVEKPFELPDGRILTVGSQSFRCAEPLFKPSLTGQEGVVSIDVLIFDSIMKCDADIQKDLLANILLAGGTTMLPGLAERLVKELTPKCRPTSGPRVVAPPERKYSTWIGGSILASLSTYKGMWISKAEYEESGPQIVHRKCF